MAVVLVGDIDEDEALAVAEGLFGDIEPGPAPVPQRAAPDSSVSPGVHELRRNNLKQAVGLVGFIAPPMLTDEAINLRVLDGLMTGLGGRVFVALRDERSLGYMAGTAFMSLKERSIFYGYSNPNPDGIDEAIDVILGELARVTEEPVTDGELAKSKEWLIGSQTMRLQTNIKTNINQAIEYGSYEVLGFGYGVVDEEADRIQQVTKEGILTAAASTFHRDRGVCVKLIPDPEGRTDGTRE
jgi:zinc protease